MLGKWGSRKLGGEGVEAVLLGGVGVQEIGGGGVKGYLLGGGADTLLKGKENVTKKQEVFLCNY